MTTAVIDLFEFIEVDKQQRAGGVVVTVREFLCRIPLESSPIQHTGQWIRHGDGFHLNFLRLAVRDINKGHCNVIAYGLAD